MKNQRGFVTIEIILVVLIISLSATLVVPNMARMVDVAQVDYEMKFLLSQIDYARSLNKNIHYNPEIFNYTLSLDNGHQLKINIDELIVAASEKSVGKEIVFQEGVEPMSENLNDSANLETNLDTVRKYIAMYEAVFGEDDLVTALSKNVENLSEAVSQREVLQTTYDGLLGHWINTDDFYITQKLENQSDNILHSIAESILGYDVTKSTSDWVGKNVLEYGMSGDDTYVIRYQCYASA